MLLATPGALWPGCPLAWVPLAWVPLAHASQPAGFVLGSWSWPCSAQLYHLPLDAGVWSTRGAVWPPSSFMLLVAAWGSSAPGTHPGPD